MTPRRILAVFAAAIVVLAVAGPVSGHHNTPPPNCYVASAGLVANHPPKPPKGCEPEPTPSPTATPQSTPSPTPSPTPLTCANTPNLCPQPTTPPVPAASPSPTAAPSPVPTPSEPAVTPPADDFPDITPPPTSTAAQNVSWHDAGMTLLGMVGLFALLLVLLAVWGLRRTAR